MKLSLKNKTIVITGASTGMGQALARSMAQESIATENIILVARSKKELNLLAIELKSKFSLLNVYSMPCDLGDIEAVRSLTHTILNEIGHVDILVNAAGTGQTAFLEDAELNDIDQLIQVNVIGLTHLCHAFLPHMIKQGSGGILNFSSFFGLKILPGYSVYAASKHYVNGLTKVLRAETAGTGVVISCVYPGPIKTAFWNTMNAELLSPPGFLFMSLDKCVRETLSGFRKGRASIIPGLRIKLLVAFLSLSPTPIVRMVNASIAELQRTKKEKLISLSDNQAGNTM